MYKKRQTIPGVTQFRRYRVRQQQNTLLQAFWLFVTVIFVWTILNIETSSLADIAGAAVMAFTALLPMYLWCAKKALGLPIFPIFALTYLWTYALQPVTSNPTLLAYSQDSLLFASITVAGFLGLGTFIWFQFVKFAPIPPKYYRAFSTQQAEPFFLLSLIASTFFTMSTLGGWFNLNGGLFAVIRAISLAVNALAIFVLGYNWGRKKLSKNTSRWFIILLTIYIITNAVSLLLVGAISAFLLTTIAFILGRRQVPWLLIILALVCFGFLHFGKAEMRSKYWGPTAVPYVQPWEYPSWFAEWIGYSFKYSNAPIEQKEEKESPLKRSSLIHLLLMVQEKTPRDISYLSGATYAIIPELLQPRFLNPNKITSHEGTHLLSIHYGLQNRKDTYTTTIGWGLLNEACANFGVLGCMGLAVVLGVGYGQVTRWSIDTPILSSRFLFAITMISFAFQTEFSAGVYVTALFQSAVPLIVVTFTLMKVYINK